MRPINLVITPRVINRFFKYANKKINPKCCWNWLSTKDGLGYGVVYDERAKALKAHRVSWTIHNGDIPDGILVLHKCDNPTCVNPRHLFLGTQSDNMKDMYNKGRHPRNT